MSLLVYAVCRTGSLDPSLLPLGCDGQPVFAICTERATALFSENHTPKANASDADFEAYDRVIEAAHAQGATLPVRYGTHFSDDALLSRAIRHRSVQLTDGLARVDGKDEITITVQRAARVVTRSARVASPAFAHAPVHATEGTGALKMTGGGAGGGRSRTPVEPTSVLATFCRRDLADLRSLVEEVIVQDAGAIHDAGVMRCLVKHEFANLFITAFEDLRDELGFDGRIGKPSPCYSFATQTLG